MSIHELGGLRVEANIEQAEIDAFGVDEGDIELNLRTDNPIIVGRRSLVEMATLSLTIAEDMSS